MKRFVKQLSALSFLLILCSCERGAEKGETSSLLDPYPSGVSHTIEFMDYTFLREGKGGKLKKGEEILLDEADVSYDEEEAKRIVFYRVTLPFEELISAIGFPRYGGLPGDPYLDFGEMDDDIVRLKFVDRGEEGFYVSGDVEEDPFSRKAPLSYFAPCHHIDRDAGPFSLEKAEALAIGASIDQSIQFLGRPCRYEGNYEPWYEFDLGKEGVLRAHYSLVEEEDGKAVFRLDQKIFDDRFRFRDREKNPLFAEREWRREERLEPILGKYSYGPYTIEYKAGNIGEVKENGKVKGEVATNEDLFHRVYRIKEGIGFDEVVLAIGFPCFLSPRKGNTMYFGERPSSISTMPKRVLEVPFNEKWQVSGEAKWKSGLILDHFVDPDAPLLEASEDKTLHTSSSLAGFLFDHPAPHRLIHADSAILEYDLSDGRILQTYWDALPLADREVKPLGRAVHILEEIRYIDPMELC